MKYTFGYLLCLHTIAKLWRKEETLIIDASALVRLFLSLCSLRELYMSRLVSRTIFKFIVIQSLYSLSYPECLIERPTPVGRCLTKISPTKLFPVFLIALLNDGFLLLLRTTWCTACCPADKIVARVAIGYAPLIVGSPRLFWFQHIFCCRFERTLRSG